LGRGAAAHEPAASTIRTAARVAVRPPGRLGYV